MSIPIARSRALAAPSLATVALCAALLTSAALAPSARAADPATWNDEQKTFYFLGLLSARNLAPFQLSPEELDLVKRGLDDALSGGQVIDLDPQVYGARAQALLEQRVQAAAQKEKTAAKSFLEAEAARPGTRRTESGAIVQDIQKGEGEQPKPEDTVVVHYHGTLRDGTVFDSSVQRGEPFRTQLDRVIPCWTEGVTSMRVGGKARLVCPSDTAYGDAGAPPRIPGGAPLVFEVELIGIEK